MDSINPLIDTGFPFEVSDLRPAPRAAKDETPLDPSRIDEESMFVPLDLVKTLEESPFLHATCDYASHFAFDQDLKNDLEKVLEGDAESSSDAVTEIPVISSSIVPDEDAGTSFWNLDSLPDCAGFSLRQPRTWEAFEKKDIPDMSHAQYMSEAGPVAFDAVLKLMYRPTGHENAVFPHDFALRALCNLALGRSSVLFRWNESKQAFVTCLENVSLSGLSQTCSRSLLTDFIAYGTLIKRLRNFFEKSSKTSHHHVAMIALQRCVAEVLDSVDAIVAPKLRHLRTVLGLQQIIKTPSRLLELVLSFVEQAKDCHTDELLISALSDQVSVLVYVSPEFCKVSQAILARVSLPWMERLASDLSIGDDNTLNIDFRSTPDFLQHTDDVETEFISHGDKSLIQQTKVALRMLSKHASNRTAYADAYSNNTTFLVGLLESASKVGIEDSNQKKTIPSEPQHHDTSLRQVGEESIGMSTDVLKHHGWHDQPSQEEYIEKLGQQMMSQNSYGASPGKLHTPDALQPHVINALSIAQDHAEPPSLDTSLDTSILQPVRQQILVQHDRANTAALQILLDDYDLMHHLDLQRAFQLLGSGDFIVRLSIALFSPEVQSAERTRGMVPTAQAMGLRLDANRTQRWPPASSELRLALSGVLADSYASMKHLSTMPPELPGSLSFSIRALPDEEIDRLTDPSSIHALDFLRIQYTPPEPLDTIITPSSLETYDQIFRFLLKFMRLAYITKELQPLFRTFPNSSPSSSQPLPITISTSHALHHLISTLMTHFMDVGIAAPWHEMRCTILNLKHRVLTRPQQHNHTSPSHSTSLSLSAGVQPLRALHEQCLDRIRTRLYLKRRHAAIHAAILDVLTAAITAASALTACANTPTPRQLDVEKEDIVYSAEEDPRKQHIKLGPALHRLESHSIALQASVERLCALLQDAADRSPRSLDAEGLEEGETSRLLLAKLRWNDFY